MLLAPSESVSERASRSKEKPYYYRTPPPGKPASNIVIESQTVPITDLRALPAAERARFNTDTAGFQLVRHESALKETDFDDEAKIADVYYKEVDQCAPPLPSSLLRGA